MKKTIILTLFALVLSVSLIAQPRQNDQRTIETKIADLLMKLPPQSSAEQDFLMAELAALGEPAVTAIAAGLVAPGAGDDVASRYAISGLVKFVARGADKNLMKNCSQALCKALGNVKNDEVKDFLLQELQYVAGEEAVAVVSGYLRSERLCDPAARVLVRIGTEPAKLALADALSNAGGKQQVILVQALGETGYAPAAAKVRALAATAQPQLKKAVLRTLAEMGDLSSGSLLAAEAAKAKYSFEATDAAGSYLLFLSRSAENGNGSYAEKACRKLVKTGGIPEYAQSVALEILVKSAGQKAVPDLMKALKSPSKEYRMAAQALLGNLYSPGVSAAVQKTARSTKNSELQAELISLMAEQNDQSAFPLIAQLLSSDQKPVQLAAVKAAAKVGQAKAVAPLTELMKTGDEELVAATQSALLTIAGEGVAEAAAAFIPQVSGAARSALIEIIARRQADRYAGLIFGEAANSDAKVRLAAARALSAVAKSGDEKKIAALLNNATGDDEIRALQEALFAALQNSGNQSGQVAAALPMMKEAGDKQFRYYYVLAKMGGTEALGVVEKAFETGTTAQKEAALKALAGWSDFTALDALYRISKNNPSGKFHDTALSSYIAGINRSKNSADQKVLMFRNAMELANGVDQKKQILQGIARNSTLPALMFVAQYLDDAALQQTAVQSVNSMVLANSGLYGTLVEGIVKKAISLNKDAEADYQKQALLKHLAGLPQEDGFVALFNGKDLTGWKGLVGNPISRAKMSPKALAEAQAKADKQAAETWLVENGILVFAGKGDNLCTVKDYADFELYVDWKLFPGKEPDAGIYLRGTPQVQIWDTSRVNVGAQVGSGGLYNNQKNMSKPLVVADNQLDEWNTFYIKMIGDKVTVYLNGQLVVDNVVLENFWDRSQPIFPSAQIELQAHGSKVAYRDIYLREIPRPKPYAVSKEEEQEGFVPMFNGMDMQGWTGNTTDYFAQEGMLVCQPSGRGSGNLYTDREYSDFIMRFEFQLTPGANNGLGIRTPREGDAAYQGMELQILDNEAEIYKNLKPYQYHGSVYGVIPAKRGFLKPVGEWNYQEVQTIGNRIKVTLNGEVILDGDIAEASKNGTETADQRKHPGLLNPSGYIGFLGHGSPLKFRNLRIKDLKK